MLPRAPLPHVRAIRYVTPLREGGSLPGLMEADDLGTYVVKFHGAGQGRKALVAEVVVGRLAAGLGLPTPELVTVDVDPILAANEPDEEVQDLLRASPGRNLGVDYLPGALDLDAAALDVDPDVAGRVLWFDALVGNVDRSWRNPNMLFWHGSPYLIDHGASLTFHHNWPTADAAARRPYDAGEHALLGAVRAPVALPVTEEQVSAAVAAVPDEWLTDEPGFDSPEAVRAAYRRYVAERLAAREAWEPALVDAVAAGPQRRSKQRPRPGLLR